MHFQVVLLVHVDQSVQNNSNIKSFSKNIIMIFTMRYFLNNSCLVYYTFKTFIILYTQNFIRFKYYRYAKKRDNLPNSLRFAFHSEKFERRNAVHQRFDDLHVD